MKRIAFRMQLNPGCVAEYRRRHDELWPEMDAVLRDAGIVDYAIWLDEPTLVLFAVMLVRDDHATDELPENPVVRRWWDHMADVMAVNPDNSPVTGELELMFQLQTDESPLT
ncbi:MAG: L-rhamnose mutarotase [Planctomycetaceae bacterium]|nr:L-rhamnose mutarotase [Planctomycetaceae bacterium]